MRKNISIILLLIVLISILPTNIAYGYYDTLEYLDVKIGKNYSSSEFITLSSENGFYIYDKSDKDRIRFQIIDPNIIITSNYHGELDVLDLQNNILTTIPGDGTMIIGSGSMDSLVQIGQNEYRGFISFISKGQQITNLADVSASTPLPRTLTSVIPWTPLW